MDCVKRSSVGQLNSYVKCGHLENPLSYCFVRSKLRMYEQAIIEIPNPRLKCFSILMISSARERESLQNFIRSKKGDFRP